MAVAPHLRRGILRSPSISALTIGAVASRSPREPKSYRRSGPSRGRGAGTGPIGGHHAVEKVEAAQVRVGVVADVVAQEVGAGGMWEGGHHRLDPDRTVASAPSAPLGRRRATHLGQVTLVPGAGDDPPRAGPSERRHPAVHAAGRRRRALVLPAKSDQEIRAVRQQLPVPDHSRSLAHTGAVHHRRARAMVCNAASARTPRQHRRTRTTATS